MVSRKKIILDVSVIGQSCEMSFGALKEFMIKRLHRRGKLWSTILPTQQLN